MKTSEKGRIKPSNKAESLQHWKRRSAIERLCGLEAEAVILTRTGQHQFPRFDNFDYFLVRTTEFAPLVPSDSVVEVWCSDTEAEAGSLVLVAGNGRLEVRRFDPGQREQVLGIITRVEAWPSDGPLKHFVR